jgi:hypothetical protein
MFPGGLLCCRRTILARLTGPTVVRSLSSGGHILVRRSDVQLRALHPDHCTVRHVVEVNVCGKCLQTVY